MELKVALTTILVTVLCLLPLMALLVHVRHKEWSLYRMFLLHFYDLKYNWFRCYLPQFQYDADYSLVLLAFVGLAFVSSIFCSMNNVLAEQYGVSGRIVRSLREKNAKNNNNNNNNNNNKLR